MGLAVALDNRRARARYEAIGYHDAGFGIHLDRWRYRDADGHEQWHKDPCIYLIKELTAAYAMTARSAQMADHDEPKEQLADRSQPAPAPEQGNEPVPPPPDPVEEADIESFPASDSPGWTGGGNPIPVQPKEPGE